MIKKLYKYDRMWVGYVKDLGVNIDTARDIVQEFYLKMNEFEDEYFYVKDKPNYYGCYVILRNMVFDLKRKEKKINLVELDYLDDEAEEEKFYDESDDKINALVTWAGKNQVTNKILNNKNYNVEDLKKLYYKTIYEEIFDNGKKISVFSRETGISYYSLYNTVRLIKEEIKNELKNRNTIRKDL
jgi:hypothetical protein